MPQRPDALKYLAPNWFAMVMSLAGLAIAWARAAPLLGEILAPETLARVQAAAIPTASPVGFPDALWVSMVYECAASAHAGIMNREHVTQAMVPLYLGRTAAFFSEIASMDEAAHSQRLAALEQEYERHRPYLVERGTALVDRSDALGRAAELDAKAATRNIAVYRDPAVILIDQLKKIYIDSELEIVDTPQWYAKVARKDYTIGFNLTGVSVDDPDGNLVENYSCKSERNYTQYCNAEVDKLLTAQSRELDREKRKKIVWDIERILVEDAARPMIQHGVSGNCWHSYVKGYVAHSNSIYNNTRFEDVWLDK